MSKIFFESKHYMFHTYALFNLIHAVKRNIRFTTEEKAELSCKFILAALSVPLNHRLSNFERLSTQYLPRELQDDAENSQKIKGEVLDVASMLYISGLPSRSGLINEIVQKNMQNILGHAEIANLFNLIENEESPFTISKKGKEYLDAAVKKTPSLSSYANFLRKTLSVRILQKSKNYYTNQKFKTLEKLLSPYVEKEGSEAWPQIEVLLFECNREGLLKTIIDHST